MRGRQWLWFAVAAVATVGLLTAAAPASGAASAPTASCSVSELFPEPGETVRISAADSVEADDYQYDVDGDGSPESDIIGDAFYDTSYESGTYRPAVTVYNDTTGTRDTATCPEVTVAENTPPTAALEYSPAAPTVGETVTFDAGGSTDDDGSVEVVRWDFGADGTVEERGVTTARTYTTAGSTAVRVVVEDDDGAVAETTVEFTVETASEPTATQTATLTPTATETATLTPTATETATETPVPGLGDDTPTAVPDGGPGPGNATVADTPGTDAGGAGGGGSDSALPIPVWQALGLVGAGGVGAGLLLCRSLSSVVGRTAGGSGAGSAVGGPGGSGGGSGPGESGGGSGSDDGSRIPRARVKRGIDRVEADSFRTPAWGGTVRVADVGFDPDVLVVTASEVDPGPDGTDHSGPGHTDGGRGEAGPSGRTAGTPGPADSGSAGAGSWSFGVMTRDEGIEQEVVAAGADALAPETLPDAVTTGYAMDMAVPVGERVVPVTGRVSATTRDGFEFTVDASALPEGVPAGPFRVTYQAYNADPESKLPIGSAFRLADKRL